MVCIPGLGGGATGFATRSSGQIVYSRTVAEVRPPKLGSLQFCVQRIALGPEPSSRFHSERVGPPNSNQRIAIIALLHAKNHAPCTMEPTMNDVQGQCALALDIIHCLHIILVVVVSGIDCCRIRNSVVVGDCSRDGLMCVGLVRLAPTDCKPIFVVVVMIGHCTIHWRQSSFVAICARIAVYLDRNKQE
jgi:hypothetical protein